MNETEIVGKISKILGYPDQFSRETRELLPSYLKMCADLYSVNNSLKERAGIYENFSNICDFFCINKITNTYLHLAFTIFLAENYKVILRQFIVEQLKNSLKDEQNVIPDNQSMTKIDSVMEKLSIFITLEDKKTLIEHVRLSVKPQNHNILNYLSQLARLMGKVPQNTIDSMHQQLKDFPDLFIPIAFDILYFWNEPIKCAQIILAGMLDSCLKQINNHDIIMTCYELLSKIENQLSYNLQPPITENFRQQLIMNQCSKEKLSDAQKKQLGELAQKLFKQFPEKCKGINALCKVISIKGISGNIDQSWLQILSDICLRPDSRKTMALFLSDLLKINLADSNSKERNSSLLEVCREYVESF